jgi:translation initiation factor 2B subunit (eIF-2B alpha/beta/delta family)
MAKEEKEFNKIISEIKTVRIQGAENIAKSGVKAYLLKPNKKSAKKILKTRPTEPLLQNAIKSISKSKSPKRTAKKFLRNLEKSHDMISKKGASLIKDDMNIYTHCHSSTVIDILKYAKKTLKKKFVVYTTEVEPLLQGRKTAEDLSKAKIPVVITPDLAAEQSMKKCDLFLFGADAFTSKEVANKIGTSTLVKLAKLYKVPTYTCGVSTKFTRKIKVEKRSPREVWTRRSKNITILNPAFDKTKLKDLNGIISEFGIFQSKQFARLARQKLKSL